MLWPFLWSFGAEEHIESETWKPCQSVFILACWKHSLFFVVFRFFLPPLKAHMSDRVSMLALSAETELVAERQHDVLASLKNILFWVSTIESRISRQGQMLEIASVREPTKNLAAS